MKASAKLAIRYFLAVLLTQFVLLVTWRQVDASTFIFVPIIVTTALAVAIAEILTRRNGFWSNADDQSMIRIIGALCFGYTLYSHFLVNVDRSRSFYILQWVESRGERGIASDEVKAKAEQTGESIDAMMQRLGEQTKMGMIATNDQSRYVLTNQGKAVVGFSNVLIKIFRLQHHESKPIPNATP